MTVYYVLLAGAFVIGIPLCKDWGLPEKQTKFLRFTYCFIIGFTFFMLSAIRKSTGYDYNLYAGWFNEIYFQPYEELIRWSREKGFVVPVKIMQVISMHYQTMFIVIAFVLAVGISVFIYKYSSLPHVSVTAFMALGFYLVSMNFMRQMIAAIIVAYAIRYINSSQPLRYIVYILFASCFHFSALLMIPFYIILKVKMNWAVLGIYTVVSVTLFIYSENIMLYITEYFYRGYDPFESIHMKLGLSPVYAVVFAVLFLIAFIFRKPLIIKNKFNGILINCLFFTAFFEFIGVKHSVISRFILYFAIVPVILLAPDMIGVLKKSIKKLSGKNKALYRTVSCAVCAAFCALGIFFYAHCLEKDNNGVIPYRTIWEVNDENENEFS